METKDAWLLLAGFILGYIGNLIATFTAPSVGSAFIKLKSGFIERNKASALASYAVVRDLKSGKRDKYLHTLTNWGLDLSFLLIFALSAIAYITAHDWLHKLPASVFSLITTWASMNR